MKSALYKISRKNLNAYMQDCYGENGAEWESAHDLIIDIIALGREQECLKYCGA